MNSNQNVLAVQNHGVRQLSREFRLGLAACALILFLGLQGCSTLPSSGPDLGQVVHGSEGAAPAFHIVDLDTADASVINQPAVDGTLASISLVGTSEPVNLIHVGDTLQVTVFEIGAALFGATGEHASDDSGVAPPAATGEALPPIRVGPDGAVSIPYVGRISAAGETTEDVSLEIQAALRGKSESPQVVVTVSQDLGNTVMVLGDVHSPGRKALSYKRESLLDMIAVAGGPTGNRADTFVRLTRHGQSAMMPLADIESGSPDDIALAAQDRVQLLDRASTFTAFGATGKVSEVAFHSAHLSLAEALARIGGPLDPQADPKGVFIFRAHQSTVQPPVVYRLDLMNPKSYFIAQQFEVRDKDLIYLANAKANILQKFLTLLGSIVSPAVTAKYIGS